MQVGRGRPARLKCKLERSMHRVETACREIVKPQRFVCWSRNIPEAYSTRTRVHRTRNFASEEVTSSGCYCPLPLERFQRPCTEVSCYPERTPRSAQARPVLPVTARLRPVQKPGYTRPLSRRQPGQSHSCIEKAKTCPAWKRCLGHAFLIRCVGPPLASKDGIPW